MGGSSIRPSRVKAVVRYLKSDPIVGLVGAGAAVLGAMVPLLTVARTVPEARAALTRAAGVPPCLTYAGSYRHADGEFRRVEGKWIESFRNSGSRFEFREYVRDPDYIYLADQTARPPPESSKLEVRLPACGGDAKICRRNPTICQNLYFVYR